MVSTCCFSFVPLVLNYDVAAKGARFRGGQSRSDRQNLGKLEKRTKKIGGRLRRLETEPYERAESPGCCVGPRSKGAGKEEKSCKKHSGSHLATSLRGKEDVEKLGFSAPNEDEPDKNSRRRCPGQK